MYLLRCLRRCLRGRRRNCRVIAVVVLLAIFFLFLQSSRNKIDYDVNGGFEGKIHQHDWKGMYVRPGCQERQNFVYIKMIKCASTTLENVFHRFGMARNLSFALPPKGRIYIGWPYTADNTMYRPPKTTDGVFNILCEHAVYDRRVMSAMMAPTAVYITSLREPFAQFQSMFNYYNLRNISGVRSSDHGPVSEYLAHVAEYEAVYRSSNASRLRYCIPDNFSMSRNLMAYNLGFPTGFLPDTKDMSDNATFIKEWLDELESNFEMVILVEHFHESMILLRRAMCWRLEDVFYRVRNTAETKPYVVERNPALVELYRNWSKVDYALYKHFRAKHFRIISEQPLEFFNEVSYYRDTMKQLNEFCEWEADEDKTFVIGESVWNAEILITRKRCRDMVEDQLIVLQNAYEQHTPIGIAEHPPSKITC